jgi:hypothetical protein
MSELSSTGVEAVASLPDRIEQAMDEIHQKAERAHAWSSPASPLGSALAEQVLRAAEVDRHLDVEAACEVMHDAYERAAVGAGWETQQASRKPWADVPEANKATMRAAVAALIEWRNAAAYGVSLDG